MANEKRQCGYCAHAERVELFSGVGLVCRENCDLPIDADDPTCQYYEERKTEGGCRMIESVKMFCGECVSYRPPEAGRPPRCVYVNGSPIETAKNNPACIYYLKVKTEGKKR